jgi:hypothetical protein
MQILVTPVDNGMVKATAHKCDLCVDALKAPPVRKLPGRRYSGREP